MRHPAPHAALLLPLLLLAAGSAEEHSFEVWKRRHSRVYATPGEEGRRRRVFQANSELIEAHNARRSSVTLAMNAFGDLTQQEWADRHLLLSGGYRRVPPACAAALSADCAQAKLQGLAPCVQCVARHAAGLAAAGCSTVDKEAYCRDPGPPPPVPPPPPPPWPKSGPLPESVDWRDNSSLPGSGCAVTEPLNQGACGGCYAFAAGAAMESAWAIHSPSHPLRRLSPQQLIDCSRAEGNNGCNGGNMANSYRYAVDHGMELASSYPFVGETNESCAWQDGQIGALFRGFHQVSGNTSGGGTVDVAAIERAVALQGPVSVAFNANNVFMQFYSGGFYTGK